MGHPRREVSLVWPLTTATIAATSPNAWGVTTGSIAAPTIADYCRRDDGTTGLIVGGVAGGVLGSIIAPGGSQTLGAIIGAGAGAIVGRAIDDGVECR